jgi:hypothetical protein
MQSALYSSQILMRLELSRQIFEKYLNTKLHKILSSGSRVVVCGQEDGRTDGQTEITKPIVTFHNFPTSPINAPSFLSFYGLYLEGSKLRESNSGIFMHEIKIIRKIDQPKTRLWTYFDETRNGLFKINRSEELLVILFEIRVIPKILSHNK